MTKQGEKYLKYNNNAEKVHGIHVKKFTTIKLLLVKNMAVLYLL